MSTDAISFRRDNGHVHVQGELSFDTALTALTQSREWLSGGDDLVIDLSAVTRSDSAGVALLLEWLRRARTAGCMIRYQNPPAQMRAIIEFSALQDILPIENADDTCRESDTNRG